MTLPGTSALPETVAPDWAPRDQRWRDRAPSEFAGRPDRPLFIGACPRSGTTLLRSMLDNHPELAVPAETDFVIPLWKRRRELGDLRREENRRRIAEWMFCEKGHGGERLRAGKTTVDEAIARVLAAPPTLGSIVETCFRIYADAHGKRRWGDKRPAYAGWARILFALFPDAQFVNVVRDPRGAVASQIPLGWGRPDAALASSTARWEASIGRVDDLAGRLRPDQLLDVRYESLVADPAGVLREVCAFAALPADDDVIATMITAERRGTYRPGWHEKVSKPVSTDSVERWRERLESPQIAFVEHVTGPQFERFGYRPTPGLDARPRKRDLAELERQRERRREKWAAQDRADRWGRLRYRRPLAAVRDR